MIIFFNTSESLILLNWLNKRLYCLKKVRNVYSVAHSTLWGKLSYSSAKAARVTSVELICQQRDGGIFQEMQTIAKKNKPRNKKKIDLL